MGTKSEVKVTFAVTFKLPQGMSIATAREAIKAGLMSRESLDITHDKELRVHLTNKETTYGKR